MSLSEEDRELIFSLAEELTGSCQSGPQRGEILVSNVRGRMLARGVSSLSDYLALVDEDPAEREHLFSSLTIHTTSWFRELAHFEKLAELAREWSASRPGETFRVWCAACSTGEEVYSVALVLETHRSLHPGFEYRIHGTDIDPVSVRKALKAVYSSRALPEIPVEHSAHVWPGRGEAKGFFTLSKELRSRCTFGVHDLNQPRSADTEQYDLVLCRNVLIYFQGPTLQGIVANLVASVRPGGRLCLGHSEAIDARAFQLLAKGNSIYVKPASSAAPGEGTSRTAAGERILLLAEVSPPCRETLLRATARSEFRVVAADTFREASLYLESHPAALVIVEARSTSAGAAHWLHQARKGGLKVPAIVVSHTRTAEASAVLAALSAGAQEHLDKTDLHGEPAALLARLREIVRESDARAASVGKAVRLTAKIPEFRPEAILLGASTGGTEALSRLLKDFPRDTPPVLVVQHISSTFALPFAERLSAASGLPLGNSRQGTELEPGKLYLAGNDYHIGVGRNGPRATLICSESPPVNRHRPAVDFLFRSASTARVRCLAALLTGMGKDGAQGLLELRHRGAITLAQDAESSIVYGMPREAVRLGAALFVGNLEELRARIEACIRAPIKEAA